MPQLAFLFRLALVLPAIGASFITAPEALTANDEKDADTLVVCPEGLQEAMQKWIAYRKKQGHRIQLIEPRETSFELNRAIRENAKNGKLKNLVLVGDSRVDRNFKNRKFLVPTDYIKAKVNVRYGAAPDIASDNKYADLDDDGAPDLTVGRIPADNPEQLTSIIDKIIRYESKLPTTAWRRKINFIAGVGGFGVVEDKIIETATKKLITEMVPSDYVTSMTYASWNSPYCPDPRQFSKTTIDRLNEGCLFWVYIGHGHYQTLDYVNMPSMHYKIFDVNQTDQIKSQSGLPIAIFLACNTCGFDQPGDCIGEQLLKQKDGPVAVLGGSRITMPYGMSVLSLDMMKDYFGGKQQTLGELIRKAKRHLVLDDGVKGEFRQMLDALGKTFSPTADLLDDERKEHAHLMHLLGDPLLRLARPESIAITADEKATSGQPLSIGFDAPFAGEALVEVSYRRDRLTFRPKPRQYGIFSDQEMKEFQEVYERANELVKASRKLKVVAGQQKIELDLPAESRGACVIRVYLAGKNQFATGARAIRLSKAPRE